MHSNTIVRDMGKYEVNQVLNAIRERRSVYRFQPGPVEDAKVWAILEAGRWAPSWTNTQPWEFIVVKEDPAKQGICDIAKRMWGNKSIEGASAIIVTCVNPEIDPLHFIEDGAVATQNMALAAHSLGLASYWLGIFDIRNTKGSVEERVRDVLKIPGGIRVVAFLPIGVPAYNIEGKRKWLRDITHYEQYGNKRLHPADL
jgi:nitroreductase